MGTAAKRAGLLAHTLLLTGAIAAALAWGGQAEAAPVPERSQSQVQGFTDEQISTWVDEIVDRQLVALGCDKTPALTEGVAVRPAGSTAEGVFDSGVVTVVPFDQGFADAQAGKVWVVGWCAA